MIPYSAFMSFDQIYNSYKKTVFNLSLNYTGNIEDAEEVTQDVFVKVYENLTRFRKEADIKTWIYRITINQSLDFIKAKKRKKRFFQNSFLSVDNEANPVHVSEFNHPGVTLEQKEAIAFIFKCLNNLPENQKTVVVLLKIENLAQHEAAAIMNTSVKAVESLFQRAKKNLEILLNKTKENEK